MIELTVYVTGCCIGLLLVRLWIFYDEYLDRKATDAFIAAIQSKHLKQQEFRDKNRKRDEFYFPRRQ